MPASGRLQQGAFYPRPFAALTNPLQTGSGSGSGDGGVNGYGS